MMVMSLNRFTGNARKNIPVITGSVVGNLVLHDAVTGRNFMMNRRSGRVVLRLGGSTCEGHRQHRIARQKHPRLKSFEFKTVFLFVRRVQNQLNGGRMRCYLKDDGSLSTNLSINFIHRQLS
jgi:hypothetical protein